MPRKVRPPVSSRIAFSPWSLFYLLRPTRPGQRFQVCYGEQKLGGKLLLQEAQRRVGELGRLRKLLPQAPAPALWRLLERYGTAEPVADGAMAGRRARVGKTPQGRAGLSPDATEFD